MNLRLRMVAGMFVGSVGLLGVGASIALVDTSRVLHTTSLRLLDSAESINAAQELESSLQAHARQSTLWEAMHAEPHRALRDAARRSLDLWFHDIGGHIGSPDEAQALQAARVRVDRYLAERERLEEDAGSDVAVSQRIEPFFDEAMTALEALTAINVGQAHVEYQTASRYDKRAGWVGATVVGLILLTIPLVLFVMSRAVFRPLRQIDRSIRGLASGKPVAPLGIGVSELQTVATTLSDMAVELKRQKDNRLRYLASVAHDLRNPIAAINMSAELIVHETQDRGDDTTHRFASVIQRQSEFLGRMVGDLLDMARSESGHLELNKRALDLRGTVGDCVELFRSYSSAHRLQARLGQEPVFCDFDPLRLSQVLNNLISNAIKYSPFGGDVVVSIARGGASGPFGIVAVTDSGTGIKADEIAGIFEPFQRSTATKDTIPGVGLGLHTARKIVEAHGGRIEVESVVGVGSTFRVFLPLARESAAFQTFEVPTRPSADASMTH
jgi:signal transduction histidine kinase